MDKVKHWPSWAKWCARNKGLFSYFEHEPRKSYGGWVWDDGLCQRVEMQSAEYLELVEIDPNTDWKDSLQRRPE